MEKRKKRFWSLMLSILMVVGLLWAVPGDSKAVAEDSGVGVWTYSGASNDVTYVEDGVQYIKDDSNNPCKITDISKIVTKDSGIYISGGEFGNTSTVIDATKAQLSIAYGNTVNCDSFEGDLYNDGTFNCNSFKGTLDNRSGGSFSCNSFEGTPKNTSTIKVKNSFKNTDSTITGFGTIEAGGPTTKIGSAGGSFELKYGSKSKSISGYVAADTEAWLLMEPNSSVGVVKCEDLTEVDGYYYVKDNIIIKPTVVGNKIKKINKSGETGYNDTSTLTAADLTDEALTFIIVNQSGEYPYNILNSGECETILGFNKIKFDTKEPGLSGSVYKVDGIEKIISAGDTISAKRVIVNLVVEEENLIKTVTTSEGDKTLVLNADGKYGCSIEYDAVPGVTKTCNYYVKDKAGNVSSLEFALTYPKDDYDATLKMDNVYYGETIAEPTINSDKTWDGDKSYEYSSDGGTTFTSTKPVAAGKYVVKAVLTNSSLYNDTSLKANFEIKRYTPTVSVKLSSTSIKVGDSYGAIIDKPDDWVSTGGIENDIKVEYKAASAFSDDAYSTEQPINPGKYILRVTMPETDKYESVIAESSSYTIEKGSINQATLTVSDFEISGGFEPNLVIDSDYDGTITYKCKLATQTEYGDSDTIEIGDTISEAGVYTAKAFVAETERYLGTESNEVTFNVKKKKVTLGVKAEATIVGEPLKFTITPSFNPAVDVQFKYEFKGKDEEDSAYTETSPLKAGDYTVRVTLAGSKIYEDATAVTTFTIGKKKPANYSVSVADIIYGGTIEPVVTTDSDGKELAKFEYKKKGEDDSSYSSVVPTDSGDYSIRATIPETDNYLMVQCENTFSIGKIDENTATVSVPDTVIGTEYEPVLSTASDGKSLAVYKYKLKDADDSAYSTTKPTAAGEYVIYVVVPETSNYKEQTCTSTFTISKKKPQIAEVSIADKFNLGDEIKPEANISPYTGPNSPVFEYKLQSAEDSAYTSEVPTEAGKYSVRAYVAESDEWEKIITKSADFIIGELKTPTAAVEIPDVYVGTKYEPLLTTDSDGKDKAVFEYKSADDEKAEFSKDKPTKAGKYIVRATVPATDRYKEAVCEGAFTISKINVEGSKVKVKDTYVGSEYTPVLTTDSDGKDKAVFEFKLASADDSEYTKDKPVKAGEYSIRAIVPETDKCLKVVCESTFKIKKKKSESYVILSDQHVGIKYKPVLTTDSDGKDKAVYEYKAKGEDDDAYTKDKPTKAGEYVLRVTIPETDEYEKIICETSFSITYLKDANISYKVSGTNGKNGYYTTDVYIAAPDGYEISTSRDGKYSDRIKYTEDITKVYMRRKSDGAQMEVMTISEIKIDKDAPQLINAVDDKNNPVDLSKTEELYADRLTLSFNDENLSTVKVNGEDIATDGNNVAIVLDAEGGDKYFAIIVEDLAGNRYSSNIVLKSAWMKDNTIPPGAKVKLSPGKGYKLSGGSWTVSGDSTVYNGDRLFYVNSAGDYVFVQQ